MPRLRQKIASLRPAVDASRLSSLVAGGVIFLLARGEALAGWLDDVGQFRESLSSSFEYDSNIYATKNAVGDTEFTNDVSLGYSRRALYSLDSRVGWSLGDFTHNVSQNFADPSFTADLSTALGPNSLSLDLGTARSHVADSLLGTRTESWNDQIGFDWSRPLFRLYSMKANFGYAGNRYDTAGLQNLKSFHAGVDLIRAINSKLSAFVGYGVNVDQTSVSRDSFDNSYSVGLSRQILPKVKGSIRVGVQSRGDSTTDLHYVGLTTAVDLTWTLNNRFSATATASRAVSTYAQGGSLDALIVSLGGTYRISKKLSGDLSLSGGSSQFLDDTGRVDDYESSTAGLHYQLIKHASLSVSGSWRHNSSNTVGTANYHQESFKSSVSFSW